MERMTHKTNMQMPIMAESHKYYSPTHRVGLRNAQSLFSPWKGSISL